MRKDDKNFRNKDHGMILNVKFPKSTVCYFYLFFVWRRRHFYTCLSVVEHQSCWRIDLGLRVKKVIRPIYIRKVITQQYILYNSSLFILRYFLDLTVDNSPCEHSTLNDDTVIQNNYVISLANISCNL